MKTNKILVLGATGAMARYMIPYLAENGCDAVHIMASRAIPPLPLRHNPDAVVPSSGMRLGLCSG